MTSPDSEFVLFMSNAPAWFTYRINSSEKGLATRRNGKLRDWQQKLQTSKLCIGLHTLPAALCAFRLAKWRLPIVTSWVSFTTQYAKHALKPRLMLNDNTTDEFILLTFLGRYYWKTPPNIVKENRVKCFEVFCTIFQPRIKVIEVKFLHINHNNYLSFRETKADLKSQHRLYNAKNWM